MRCAALPLFLVALALLAGPRARAERALVGQSAPWFLLKSITGRTVTHRQLRGRPVVLVVGRSQAAAPACKTWILALFKRLGPDFQIFQVIVTDNPWYLPRSLVMKRIKGFVPAEHHHRVLVEWYTVFADIWGVPQHDDPTVFALDSGGVVRWRLRGPVTARVMDLLLAALHRR